MKNYKDLEFTDNFMFVKILTSRPELCKELLELILQKRIGSLAFVGYEETLLPAYEARGIRLDVRTESDAGEVFDVEMQVQTELDLPKRCRYYHAALDVEQISKGADYSQLKKTFVIFICKDRGDEKYDRAIYRYEQINEEDLTDKLEDGNCTVIVNAACKDEGLSPDMRSFLEYIRSGRVSDNTNSLANRLDEAVRSAVESGRWSVEYMRWEEELKHIGFIEHEKGVAEGLEQGAARERINTEKERLRADAAEERAAAAEREVVKLKEQLKTGGDSI